MKVIVSLGSNKNQIENIEIAEKELKAFFSAIRFLRRNIPVTATTMLSGWESLLCPMMN